VFGLVGLVIGSLVNILFQGAALYDFTNLFLLLLRIFGKRRE